MSLTVKTATVPEVKLMYHGLTIPGDFSKACFAWQDAFPLHEPMKYATKTEVYVRIILMKFIYLNRFYTKTLRHSLSIPKVI